MSRPVVVDVVLFLVSLVVLYNINFNVHIVVVCPFLLLPIRASQPAILLQATIVQVSYYDVASPVQSN